MRHAFLLTAVLLSSFRVAAQQSATLLDAPLVVVPATERIHHLLDWNGDGLMDFAALNGRVQGSGLRGYLNDGQGGLDPVGGGGGGGVFFETHMETFDANLDGRDDLVWVEPLLTNSSFNGFLSVFTFQGTRLQRVPHLEYTSAISHGTLLDADGDGDVDRVRVLFNTLTLDLFEQDAGGTWTRTETAMTLGFSPKTMVKLDYDGDAYPDLYLQQSSSVSHIVSLAGGSLHDPVRFEHTGLTPKPMVVPADVDGDGDQDLALFGTTNYVLYRRTGPASWQFEAPRIGGPAAKLADVDGDGDLDGVCCGSGGDGEPQTKYFDLPSTFRVSLNDGTGEFAPAFTFPGLGSLEIAGAADLDQDGDVDLAAGQCIYYGRGPLTRAPGRRLARAQSERTLADYDRDGDADFTAGLGGFERHLGDGNSHLQTLRCPSPPEGATDVGPGLPGDWDGDGDSDLIVRRRQGSAFLEMRLFLNEGGGTYADGGPASNVDFLLGIASVDPANAFSVDLDLDGDLDLATTYRDVPNSSHWTKTWINDGAGRFTYAWQRRGWAVGFFPLHGSPAPDALLVSGQLGFDGHSAVHVYPGLGDGTFAGSGFYSEGSVLDLYLAAYVGPASVACEDFDRDGDLDLVGAFQFGGASFLEGKAWFLPSVDGSLSLDAKVLLDDLDSEFLSHPEAPNARTAVAGDVDGDGWKDVILSSPFRRRSAISIVRKDPAGSGWLEPVHQVVYPSGPSTSTYSPYAVGATPGACLDVDADGDGDYVTDVIFENILHDSRDFGARRQDRSGRGDAEGRVPTLGATGLFLPGELVTLRLRGVPSGVPAVMRVAGPAPLGRTRSIPERFVPQFSFVTLGPLGPGAGFWQGSFAVPASLVGVELHFRADLIDPLHPTQPLRSNVLELVFGR